MTSFNRLLVAALILPCAAIAQTATPPTPQAPPAQPAPAPAPAETAPPPAASGATQKAVEQRIAALAKALAITPDQQADWAAFAQAMRDNAASTDALFTQRAQSTATMSAVDNMKSYAAIARSYADNTEHLSAAFETIYAKFSPDQKQAADTLFRQKPSPPRHTRHRR